MSITRLIRRSDASLVLDLFTFLVREHGLPRFPIRPGPQRDGVDMRAFVSAPGACAFDWAEQCFSRILPSMGLSATQPHLIVGRESAPPHPDWIGYSPDRAHEPGHFISRLLLDFAELRLATFEAERVLDDYQSAALRLCACAYFRQGFVLSQCLPALSQELTQFRVPQRFVENMLIFGTCLTLRLHRQSVEEILSHYGDGLSPPARHKIPVACAQIDTLWNDVKLLRLIVDRRQRPLSRSGFPGHILLRPAPSSGAPAHR